MEKVVPVHRKMGLEFVLRDVCVEYDYWNIEVESPVCSASLTARARAAVAVICVQWAPGEEGCRVPGQARCLPCAAST